MWTRRELRVWEEAVADLLLVVRVREGQVVVREPRDYDEFLRQSGGEGMPIRWKFRVKDARRVFRYDTLKSPRSEHELATSRRAERGERVDQGRRRLDEHEAVAT